MRFYLFVTAFFFAGAISLFGSYCEKFPIEITQPDGTIVHCFATGDEFYNWVHDADGYTIIRDAQGFLVYAELKNDELVSSGYFVGKTDPKTTRLTPWINISVAKKNEIKAAILKEMPADKLFKNEEPKRGNSGTLNNLVVYIRFSDQSEFANDTTHYWNMFNNATPNYSSMYNYFQKTSSEQMFVPSTFYPLTNGGSTIISYQDIHPRSYYMPYHPVTNPNGYYNASEREHPLLKRAIEAVRDQIPVDLDLDYNDDGDVDNVCFIIRGGPTAWATLLWPHRWVLPQGMVQINGLSVRDYNFLVENELDMSRASVLAHEMYHTFGAPDLYRYSDKTITPVGSWDLMAHNASIPQLTTAYTKYKYGRWMNEIPKITENGRYTVFPMGDERENAFQIASPNSSTEFFVVEYRSKKDYWERGIPGNGILIYRINTKVQGNADGPPDETYIFRPNAANTITEGNLGYAGFSSNQNRTEFSDETNPPCFLSNNMPGGIHIKNISAVGDSMTFEVLFKTAPKADFMTSLASATPGCSIDFFDLSVGYIDTWMWNFEGANIATSSEQNPVNIIFSTAGRHKVTLTVSGDYGTTVKESFIDILPNTPTPAFIISQPIACIQEPVRLTDQSDLCPLAWKWSFSPDNVTFIDGTDATTQHPVVFFNEEGTYSITLEVSNSNGTSTITQDNLITIGTIIIEEEYFENFESMSLFSDKNWTTADPVEGIAWNIYKDHSLGLDNTIAGVELCNAKVNERARLITPAFSLPEGYFRLEFMHAYAMKKGLIIQQPDSVYVKISDDCGLSWETLQTFYEDKSGNFATVAPFNTEFFPEVREDWCGEGWGAECIELDLSKHANRNNLKVCIETVKRQGNNFFIDNFRIFKTTEGINDPNKVKQNISIVPNPNNGDFQLIANEKIQNGKLFIYDLQGRCILSKNIHNATERFDISDFPAGLYLIRIHDDNGAQSLKIVKY